MPLTPAQTSQLSLSDLEVAWLRKVSANSTPASIEDLRMAVYGANERTYWAATSGLLPVESYTLDDHKVAALKIATASTGTLADLMQRFFAANLP